MEIFTNKLAQLRLFAAIEGISFLVLIGIAVPLKYVWQQPWLVQNMGMIHGLSFILYIFSIIQNKIELGWATGKTLLAILLSFVPFGPFYVIKKMLPDLNK